MKVLIINGHYSKVLGGSEIQCHQIAGTLYQKGIDVTYVAVNGFDESNKPSYPLIACKGSARHLIDICLQYQPDIVYWRYNKRFLAPVVAEMEKRGIPLVFSVSHIHDLKPFAYKPIPGLGFFQKLKRRGGHLVKGWQYAKGLKQVAGVICNNEEHLTSITHSNKAYIPNSPYLEYDPFQWHRKYVVWVGNLKEHKHPELFINLAKDLKDLSVDFLMVGKIQQEAYQYVENTVDLPDNFHFLGPNGIKATNGIIRGSELLIHTCEPEGFPNVFLQAWGFSKPVVSLYFDPGGKIVSGNAGVLSGNYEQLKKDVEKLVIDDQLRSTLGASAKTLIEADFIKEKNVNRLLTFLKQTLER